MIKIEFYNLLEKISKKESISIPEKRKELTMIEDKRHIILAKENGKQKNLEKEDLLIIIGIGGSILGTQSIISTLKNKNLPEIIILDTINSGDLQRTKAKINNCKGKIILYVISKSGKTFETLKNYQSVIAEIKKKEKDYKKNTTIITQNESLLWNLGKKEGFSLLEIPSDLSGRYSIFSAVSLAPLSALNFNIDKFLEGARDMKKKCSGEIVKDNPALASALIHYNLIKRDFSATDLFIFSKELENLGKWYRQLFAESLGKSEDFRMAPMVSIGSTDLHSMAQLYLGGKNDKLHTFVCTKDQDKYLNSIAEGTIKTFLKKSIPSIKVEFDSMNSYNLGSFYQWKIMEVIYIASLLKVNAFDQPSVELYKKEVSKLL